MDGRGDPDAAYLAAKKLQSCYERFHFFVSGICKSAGTLVALGANELVFSEYGELGPLDVQIPKRDEIGIQESGLVTTFALDELAAMAYSTFEGLFIKIIGGSGNQITVPTAGRIATDLTAGLLAPIYQQIDPLRLGEALRALNIANQYGKALEEGSSNLLPSGLSKLISEYATHSYVIDQDEAKKIFQRVSACNQEEEELRGALDSIMQSSIEFSDQPVVGFLSDENALEKAGGAGNDCVQEDEGRGWRTDAAEKAEQSALSETGEGQG